MNLSDLSGKIIRLSFPILNKDEKEEFVVVRNPIGEQRKEILENIIKVSEDNTKGKEVDDNLINDYYGYLIKELTNIEMDDMSIREVFLNPTLEFQMVIKELDDIVYELQYENLCESIKNKRIEIAMGMKAQEDVEYSAYLDSIQKQLERVAKQSGIEKNVNEVIDKIIRDGGVDGI